MPGVEKRESLLLSPALYRLEGELVPEKAGGQSILLRTGSSQGLKLDNDMQKGHTCSCTTGKQSFISRTTRNKSTLLAIWEKR